MSVDAFAAFEEAGLDQPVNLRQVGRRFAETVLALGGSVNAKQVFRMFRGRNPSVEPLLKHYGFTEDKPHSTAQPSVSPA